MMVLGIDPGSVHSGVVLYDEDRAKVISSGDVDNDTLLNVLRLGFWGSFVLTDCDLAIEDIEGMGQMVGRDVFETCVWIGRFIEAWEHGYEQKKAHRISRGDEKVVLCGRKTVLNPKTGKRMNVSDSMIRAAIIDRFPSTGGGKIPQIGIVKNKGPLFGVSGHAWSALAVVLTYLETRK